MSNFQRGLAGGGLFDEDASSDPLSAAQDVMYEAWDCGAKRGRVALAKQALEISELCADAWTLLAEEAAKNVVEERGYLEKAVAAGEAAVRQALGADAFEDEKGYFWGILETRPYMRARAALAECLWETGERDDAVAHWQDMLRLCPNDNLGVRHILGPKLLGLNQLAAACDLLEEYEEPKLRRMGLHLRPAAVQTGRRHRRRGQGAESGHRKQPACVSLPARRQVPAQIPAASLCPRVERGGRPLRRQRKGNLDLGQGRAHLAQ